MTVNADKLSIEVGSTVNLETDKLIYNNKTHITKTHGAATRYISDSPSVASVSADGVITANSPGKAVIYTQDIGGLWCTTEVKVK